MSRFQRPFSKNLHGRVTVRLRTQEREYLRALCVGFLEHLASDDPALERLSPTVYADPDLEAEYQNFTGTDLDASREAAVRDVLRTIFEKSLDPETAELWMRAFNDIRLVLGTQLGVTEEWRDDLEPDDPRAERYFLYRFLTEVVGCLVWALYEQGNREPGFVVPNDSIDFDAHATDADDDDDFDALATDADDDDDDYDYGNEYGEDGFDDDDDDDDDDVDDDDDDDDFGDDDDFENDDAAEAFHDDDIALLVTRLESIENLGDLESLTGVGGLERNDPPADPPEPANDPNRE